MIHPKQAGFQIFIQGADLATTSTSLVDVSGMSFSVKANKNYWFQMSGRIGSSGGTGGKLSIITPASCTLAALSFGNSSSGNLFTGNAGLTSSGTETNTYITFVTTAGLWFISGSVLVGATAGTVKLQARTVTSGTFTVFAGSSGFSSQLN